MIFSGDGFMSLLGHHPQHHRSPLSSVDAKCSARPYWATTASTSSRSACRAPRGGPQCKSSLCLRHQNYLPARLLQLLRSFSGCMKGGMHSIRNYVSVVTEWAQACGHPDPRLSEPWVYRRFRLEAPKHLQVVEGSRAKFAIKAPHLKVMAEHAVVSDLRLGRTSSN
jgi:hypothetical protein